MKIAIRLSGLYKKWDLAALKFIRLQLCRVINSVTRRIDLHADIEIKDKYEEEKLPIFTTSLMQRVYKSKVISM